MCPALPQFWCSPHPARLRVVTTGLVATGRCIVRKAVTGRAAGNQAGSGGTLQCSYSIPAWCRAAARQVARLVWRSPGLSSAAQVTSRNTTNRQGQNRVALLDIAVPGGNIFLVRLWTVMLRASSVKPVGKVGRGLICLFCLCWAGTSAV